ncbi:MAG: hypothetical protein O2890_05185 [Cyanobacteria bacterium]|nr:hypothetical protein [Cyanobacteriota bacterium]MDA0865798.1 hypothetical protein [Cyanobacteriota bacterium]
MAYPWPVGSRWAAVLSFDRGGASGILAVSPQHCEGLYPHGRSIVPTLSVPTMPALTEAGA